METTAPPGAAYSPRDDWTHPPDRLPDLRLTRRSPVSFTANDVEMLAAWLGRRGWHALPGRSPSEHIRLVCGRRLVVLYHSGSVLVQGPHTELTLELLGQLESEAAR